MSAWSMFASVQASSVVSALMQVGPIGSIRVRCGGLSSRSSTVDAQRCAVRHAGQGADAGVPRLGCSAMASSCTARRSRVQVVSRSLTRRPAPAEFRFARTADLCARRSIAESSLVSALRMALVVAVNRRTVSSIVVARPPIAGVAQLPLSWDRPAIVPAVSQLGRRSRSSTRREHDPR